MRVYLVKYEPIHVCFQNRNVTLDKASFNRKQVLTKLQKIVGLEARTAYVTLTSEAGAGAGSTS